MTDDALNRQILETAKRMEQTAAKRLERIRAANANAAGQAIHAAQAKAARRRPKGDGYLMLRREGKWYGDREARHLKDGTWYACFTADGGKVRESSGDSSRSKAALLLRKRLKEIEDGLFIRGATHVTLAHLRDLVVADYARNGRKTSSKVKEMFAHLARILGETAKADRIPRSIAKYVATRLEEKAEPGTVNRELSALRRAYKLALQAREIAAMPYIELLEEHNVRTGFFTEQEVAKVVKHLPERLRDPVLYAWWSGWRAGEVFHLEWRHVNAKDGEIRLEANETKGGDVRILPYHAHPKLAELIDRRRRETENWQKEHGQVVPWVFWHVVSDGDMRKGGTRKAAPVQTYARKWIDACKAAGVAGRLFHDLRRSFAIEAKRRGLEDGVVMALAGWKTRSVFDRYRIVDTKDLRDGMARLARPTPTQGEQDAATQANE